MDSGAPHHTSDIHEEKKPTVLRPITSSHVWLMVQLGLGARLLTREHIPVHITFLLGGVVYSCDPSTLHSNANQELSELPLGPNGGIPLCPAREQKDTGEWPSWSPSAQPGCHPIPDQVRPGIQAASNSQMCFSDEVSTRYLLSLLLSFLRHYYSPYNNG